MHSLTLENEWVRRQRVLGVDPPALGNISDSVTKIMHFKYNLL